MGSEELTVCVTQLTWQLLKTVAMCDEYHRTYTLETL